MTDAERTAAAIAKKHEQGLRNLQILGELPLSPRQQRVFDALTSPGSFIANASGKKPVDKKAAYAAAWLRKRRLAPKKPPEA